MKSGKKAGSIVISVILWIVILIAALYSFVTLATRDDHNIASIGGISPLVVQTESMAPTFNAGDLILIKKCDPATLEEGDVVTFHTIIENQYALNTHRIVEIKEENGVRSYVTQGDNNSISDDHIISDGDIVGKYMSHVPKVGKLMDFLSSKIGFLVVIVLPMLLFFIYQVYNLIMISIEFKKVAALEAAKEAAEAMVAEKEAAKKKEEDEEPKSEASKSEATEITPDDAAKAKAEAEKALAEALRMKEEAERVLAEAKAAAEKDVK